MGEGERQHALESLFKLCENKYNIKIDFNYNFSDQGITNRLEYLMCYNKNKPELYKFCGPDWTFHSWPSANINSFEETRDEIIEASKIEPIINKVGWLGAINSKPREILKSLNSEYLDIQDIRPIEGMIDNKISNYKSLPELTQFKILIDLEGVGYSGRFKYLLFTKRPILFVDRTYTEYFYNDLIPFIHYIPVKNDLSDLIEKIEWINNNYDKSQQIATNAYKFAITNFTQDKIIDRIYYVYNNIKNNSNIELFINKINKPIKKYKYIQYIILLFFIIVVVIILKKCLCK
jgi:hypothetical protein